jgi:hypothetical protein
MRSPATLLFNPLAMVSTSGSSGIVFDQYYPLKKRSFPGQDFACGLPLRSRLQTGSTSGSSGIVLVQNIHLQEILPLRKLRVRISPAGSRSAHACKSAQLLVVPAWTSIISRSAKACFTVVLCGFRKKDLLAGVESAKKFVCYGRSCSRV